MTKLPFRIDCRALRDSNPAGETLWRQLMSNKRIISQNAFTRVCDTGEFLAGQPLEEYMSDDPSAAFYRSYGAGHESVYFIRRAGFEFFWW
jgi:hypothetical protein